MSGLVATKLSRAEIAILRPLLFANGSRRHRTALAIGAAANAGSYVELCTSLSKTLGTDADRRMLLVGHLARLNDAGLNLMRAITRTVKDSETTLSSACANKHVQAAMKQFSAAAAKWLAQSSSAGQFKWAAEANVLAKLGTVKPAVALLASFIEHHVNYGSGVHWFVLNDQHIVLDGAEDGLNAGDFGYRLHALGRLAVQCGIIDALPPALQAAAPPEPEDEQ
jgi:hypothetical protein